MKLPEACESMEDIRTEIDRIDQTVIQLLGERYRYVQAAAAFKKDTAAVKAPARFEAMLVKRREWAVAAGLSPDVIEKMYTDLVNYFIAEELKHWQSKG
ncbi:isochorismate lyase [Chitinophaga solisilvae]|uniref:chorismate mutase n=1 Tax=Chitinophaga solisilvae TaxID=1233460 RepID=A0A3S1B0J5_9BACT|nr:isochorismate lyase [Chitinophaga solisilvae]NSL85802.1 isochorismate lyase [Chitinophaga solisilvae]